MRVDVLTLFPPMFEGFLEHGLVKIAREKDLLEVTCHDFRAFATDRHRSVDDRPYGGGPGMVLMCGPLFACDEAVVTSGRAAGLGEPRRVMLTPQGRPLNQELLEELAREPWLIVLCGHYEGFDERIRLGLQPLEVSLGDYVLSGGEVGAMVLVDGVARLQAGALGHPTAPASTASRARVACSKVRSTRVRVSSAGWRSPRSSSPVTTARSRAGDTSRPWHERANDAPTCWGPTTKTHEPRAEWPRWGTEFRSQR